MTMATDPPVSEKQRRAMEAAAHGHSTLGIPKKVGQEFVGKDMEPRDWRGMLRGLFKWIMEEEKESEHADDAQGPTLQKDEVNYSEGDKTHRCENCMSFLAPKGCKVVIDAGEPDMWCDKFQKPLANDQGGIAAGMILCSPNGKVLLLKRSQNEKNYKGHWALPGGKADKGEDALTAARREVKEEIGDVAIDGEPKLIDKRTTPTGMTYHTFSQPVADEFVPTLNDEHDDFRWCDPSDLPEPVHPAVKSVLQPKTAQDSWAFDKSMRDYDKNGWLHVEKCNISKANICPYFGKEVPDWETLGLDPEKKYQLLRDPDELRKAADTFNNLPLLSEHVPVSAIDHRPDLVIGSTGSDSKFEDPYLTNGLVVWVEKYIDAIEDERQKELSCAYRYRADMTPGQYKGESYDGVMRDIAGNHVALVKEGRAGPDVVVGDSKPEEKEMSAKTLSRRATVVLGALFGLLRPKMIAQDSKLDWSFLRDVNTKNFAEHKSKIIQALKDQKVIAKDAEIGEVKELLDQIEKHGASKDGEANSANPLADPDETMDEGDPEEFLKKHLGKDNYDAYDRLRKAKDAKDAAGESREDEEGEEEGELGEDDPPSFPGKPEVGKGPVDKKAMDSAIRAAVAGVRKTAKELRAAERACRPYVGDLAMDSFETGAEVYRHTLKALGVKNVEGIHESALSAVLSAYPVPGTRPPRQQHQAQDGAPGVKSFGERFPGASKIRVIG